MADVQLSTRGGTIKTAYEAQADTNVFTDAEKTKLSTIQSRANHTGTQAFLTTISNGTANKILGYSTSGVPAELGSILNETVISANHTLTLINSDHKMLRVNSTSAIVVTIPTNATVAFPLGSIVNLLRWNTGTVTVAPAGGVTILKATDRALTIRAQYEVASLWKQAADVWVAFGGLTSL